MDAGNLALVNKVNKNFDPRGRPQAGENCC